MASDLYRMDRSKTLANQLLNYLERIWSDFTSVQNLLATMTQEADDEAGPLTTRTSDTVGEATLGASHRIQTGQTVNVQWAGGSRLNVVVGTVAGAVVPFSGGTGDVLPAQSTALTIIGYLTVAEQFGYVNLALQTDALVAKASYDELNSFVGNAGPSLTQVCARHRQ